MSVFFVTSFICLFAALVVFLYVQYNILLNQALGKEPSAGVSLARKNFSDKSLQSTASSTRWKAVRIKAGLMCCQKAEKLRGRIFLISEAPVLPLINCNSNNCQCGYSYLDDRRRREDRRDASLNFSAENQPLREERRKLKDRRKLIM